jgi:multidrug efflux pump subunit AcrB
MNGLVSWFARNGVAANLLMIIAFAGGIFGYSAMEREMFPVVKVSGASVSMSWPGASPRDIEEQIVTRIEEAVASINGLDRITSIASEGFGVVNIRGRDDINMDVFLDEIKIRVDQINNLPQAAFRPQVTRWERRNWYFGMALNGDIDPRELRRIGREVRDSVARLPGGELAVLQGSPPEQVNIEVSEEALRRFGMTLGEVASAVRQSSLNASGGRIESPVGDVAIMSRNLADSAEEFSDIIIRQTSSQGTVRVADVATVIDGFANERFSATHNDRPTVFIMLPEPDNMDIPRYAEGLRKFIENANRPGSGVLPEGVRIDILWDDSDTFNARMDLIINSALMGALLVLLVLVLFLRPIVAFWVTVGIITAFAGAVLLMPLLGVSWNILSTFAVLLVIGVIVDDAIIVGENIHKEVESGRREGIDAAVIGTQLVLKPVIFGVLTTMIAFLPWAFVTGPTRMFTQQISFVVVAALTFSIIESMFILPNHLAHMKKQRFDGPAGGFLKLQRRIADSLLWFAHHLYKPVLEIAIRYRYATVAFFFSLFGIAAAMQQTGIVPFKFMPEIEADLIQVNIQMPDGTPFERLMDVRDQLQAAIAVTMADTKREHPEIEGGLIRDASVVASDRQIQSWVGLAPPEQRPQAIRSRDLAERLRAATGDIQDAEEIDFSFTFNRPDTGVQFALSHPDLDRLRSAADYLKTHLTVYSEVYDISDNLSSAAEEIRLVLKPGATALGITLNDISRQVMQAYYGEEVQRLPRDGQDVRVMVRFPDQARRDLDSLSRLMIRTPDGREIPITQVAEFDFAPGINRIVRRNRVRSVAVSAQVLGEGGRGRIMSAMERDFWPAFQREFPDVGRDRAGGFEEEQRFFSEVQRLLLIAFGAMYMLLAIAFRSYWQPLLLLTALPFAYCGAIFGLALTGTPMAMFAFFGIAAAAGVVINDNLVLIDYVNRRRDEGAGAVQALVDAGVSRFRPILLTSVTTFVGILPLMAERSVQAQFLKPMIVSLGFAVAFALFISLLMVPALYAVGVEIGRIFRWTWGGKPYRQIGDSYTGEVIVDEEELIGTSLSGGHGPRPAPAE